MKVTVGIGDGQGVVFARALVESLHAVGCDIILACGDAGRRSFTRYLRRNLDRWAESLEVPLVGEFHGRGRPGPTVILPSTMPLLSRIAAGTADGPVEAAAELAMRERGRLLLVLQSTPLTTQHLERIASLARYQWVTVMPLTPDWTERSRQGMVSSFCERIMDHIGVPFKPAKKIKRVPPGVKATRKFAKEYARAWTRHTKRPRDPIAESSKLWSDMVSGRQMADRLKIGYAEFIQAQVDGLQAFRDNAFPMPNQLHTAQAEMRAIRWDEGGMVRPTDLRLDERYIFGVQAIKSGTADLNQARYVSRCQKNAQGRVHPIVRAYIQRKEREDET